MHHSVKRTLPVPETRRSYIFDTVSLSNFALVGRLDLLVSRYGKRAVITPEVYGEITDGVVAGYVALQAVEDAVSAQRITQGAPLSTASERHTYRDLLHMLAPGEASCLAHAASRGGTVVTDDRTARQYCAEHKIPVTGTIGILRACSIDGALSAAEADDILDAMIAAGSYSPVPRVSDLK
jgi:predicted nucleic acid-binding protein